jgi:hypothetical protein
MIDTGGIFADRLLGAILGLPAINLSTSFLPSPEAEPGVFAIRNWIKGWPANVRFHTRYLLQIRFLVESNFHDFLL